MRYLVLTLACIMLILSSCDTQGPEVDTLTEASAKNPDQLIETIAASICDDRLTADGDTSSGELLLEICGSGGPANPASIEPSLKSSASYYPAVKRVYLRKVLDQTTNSWLSASNACNKIFNWTGFIEWKNFDFCHASGQTHIRNHKTYLVYVDRGWDSGNSSYKHDRFYARWTNVGSGAPDIQGVWLTNEGQFSDVNPANKAKVWPTCWNNGGNCVNNNVSPWNVAKRNEMQVFTADVHYSNYGQSGVTIRSGNYNGQYCTMDHDVLNALNAGRPSSGQYVKFAGAPDNNSPVCRFNVYDYEKL